MAALAVAGAGALIGAGVAQAAGFALSTGASWGWMVGSWVGNAIFSEGATVESARLTDLTVQTSTEGAYLAYARGTVRVAGNVIWSTQIIPSRHEQEVGGKGGGGTTQVSWTYSISFAVAFLEGPVVGYRRLWGDSKLFFSAANDATLDQVIASQERAAALVLYPGSATQSPDATIQSHVGAADTPAYRDTAYMVATDFQLADFANHLPSITAEIVIDGSTGSPVSAQTVNTSSVTGFIATGSGAANMAVPKRWKANSPDVVMVLGNETTGSLYASSAVIIRWGLQGVIRQSAAITLPYLVDRFTLLSACYNDREDIVFCKKYTVSPTDPEFTDHVRVLQIDESNGAIYSAGSVYSNDARFRHTTLPSQIGNKIWIRGVHTGIDTIFSASFEDLGDVVRTASIVKDLMTLYSSAGASAVGPLVFGRSGQHYAYVASPFNKIVTFDDSFNVLREVTPSQSLAAWNSPYSTMVEGEDGYLYMGANKVDPYSGQVTAISALASYVSYNTLASFWSDGTLFSIADEESSVSDTHYGVLKVIPLSPTLPKGTVQLGTFVSAVCSKSNLATGDITTTALTDILDGALVSRPSDARQVLEPLGRAYLFDTPEYDGKIVFTKRNGIPIATLTAEEVGVTEEIGEAQQSVEPFFQEETELPQELRVNFTDSERDYQIGMQYARRQVTQSKQSVTITLPVVMTSQKGAQIAEVLLRNVWTEKARYKTTLHPKYAFLVPSDVIVIPTDVGNVKCRVVQAEFTPPCLLGAELVGEEILYVSGAVGNDTGSTIPTQQLASSGVSTLYFLDIPSLRVQDASLPGVYVAVAGYSAGWKGAVIYLSKDGGASWDRVAVLNTSAVVGYTTTALGDFAGGNTWDLSNSLKFRMTSYGAAVASVPEASIYAGANAFLVGSEIVQAMNASTTGNDVTMTRLLRGRRGTEQHISTHTNGEPVVALTYSALRRATDNVSDVGLERLAAAVTLGQTLEAATKLKVKDTGVSLRPLSPVQIGGGRISASGDRTIFWQRRSRMGDEYFGSAQLPLGETSEKYDVDIYDSTFTTLKRTFTDLTNKYTPYTTSQETTDFGSLQSSIGVEVFQKSEVVGRGFGKRAIIY